MNRAERRRKVREAAKEATEDAKRAKEDGDILESAVALLTQPKENRVELTALQAARLAEHVAMLDNRFAGILTPQKLLERTANQGAGFIDGILASLQRLNGATTATIGQIQRHEAALSTMMGVGDAEEGSEQPNGANA